MKFVDIHSHILPGMDDGSRSLEMTLNMLKIAVDEGIGTIYATPHNMPGKGCPSKEKVLGEIYKLQEVCDNEGIPITIMPGTEYFFREEVEDILDRGEAITIGDTDLVLIEFDPSVDKNYVVRAVNTVLDCGYTPIIAHVERYFNLMEKKYVTIGEMRKLGALIQVNCGSIIGSNGKPSMKDTKALLKLKYVDFIGTDAHSDRHRSPRMAECAKLLNKKFGKEYAQTLLYAENLD